MQNAHHSTEVNYEENIHLFVDDLLGNSSRRWLVRFIIFTLSVCFSSLVAPPLAMAQPTIPSQMLPQDFDQWVAERRKKGEIAHQEPKELTESLLQRFEQGRYSSDEAVTSIVNASSNFESSAQGKLVGTERYHYPQTLALIARLNSLAYAREGLQATLHRIAGDLYISEGKYKEAGVELEQCRRILPGLHSSAVKRSVESAVALGGIYLMLSQENTTEQAALKQLSEKSFLKAFRYPWPGLDADAEPDTREYLRDKYVSAGRGLIFLRSGNLKALKELDFAPAVADRIDAELQDAINKAQKEQDEREALLKKAMEADKAKLPKK